MSGTNMKWIMEMTPSSAPELPGLELIAAPLFPQPFFQGHCVVNSFAHAKANPSADFAKDLAARAYDTPRTVLEPSEMVDAMWGHDVTRLLDPKDGGGYMRAKADTDAWLRLAGLIEVERFEFYRPATPEYNPHMIPMLGMFAREHPMGRWVIGIQNHAVALVEGKLYGAQDYHLPMRVQIAMRVEEAP